MELSAEQQVLLALYIEYQKDVPDMNNVTFDYLEMNQDVFNAAIDKLDVKGYLNGFKPARGGKGNKILVVWLNGVTLNNSAIRAAEELLDSLKLEDCTTENIMKKIYTSAKEDVKDIIAKYLAEKF
jgi:hypothetical protein